LLPPRKKAAERYRDYRVAEADGYRIFMPDQHQNVYHFVLESADSETKGYFDPNRPPAFLYTKTDGPNPDYKLVGVMYTAPFGATEEELSARIPLSIARWHEHINICIPPQTEQRNWLMGDRQYGLNGSITTAEACRAAGGHFKSHLSGWMTHVYPFENRFDEDLERGHGRRSWNGQSLYAWHEDVTRPPCCRVAKTASVH
jgi:hypothetical protein